MSADLTDARYARPVAAALVASGAFTVDMRLPRDQWFRWKSGILAPCGCNCRRLNTLPAIRRLIDDTLTEATRASFPDADYIVAVAHAGIPWAKTIAERLDLPLAYVRAEARADGGPLVECSPGQGARAVLVEDVVASGGSAARAIEALYTETGLRVVGVQSIVNWNFPQMRALLAPWTVRALTSYGQVLASAREAGLVSAADVEELLRFYADPRGHPWGVGGQSAYPPACQE
jgi:orotate phosphoribosyltransferase